MNNQKSIFAGLVVVLVIVAIVIFAVTGKKNDKSTNATPSTTSSSTATTDKTTTPTTSANASTASAVTISNFAFSPKEIAVKAGTTVTWTNNDDVGHTITADTASSDAPNSKSFTKGETYSFTFKKAGTYTYHCSPHPYMHGTVVVTQ